MVNPTPGTRPDWVDDELFPFDSRFVEIDGCHVHYVDEGSGPTLLLLHGNPTWSFLYRDVIRLLRDDFRCVALDYPGFGLSSAPWGYGFTAAEHADVVAAFVETLDLTDVTPMMQDWGGPIGVAALSRTPDRCRALIIANTWAWPRSDPGTTMFSRTLGGPVGRVLIERLNLFAERIVPLGHRRRELTRAEREQYTGPFPDAEARVPTHVFPRELLAASELLGEAAAGLERLSRERPLAAARGRSDGSDGDAGSGRRHAVLGHLPALIVWGAQDPAFTAVDRARWQAAFPDARTVVIGDAGHYLADDAPDDVADAIRSWFFSDAAGAVPGT